MIGETIIRYDNTIGEVYKGHLWEKSGNSLCYILVIATVS